MKNYQTRLRLENQLQKNYVDNLFDDPSIIKNSAHVDFNDKNLDNVRFVKINSLPAVGENLAAKYCVNQAIYKSVDEPTLVRKSA